jgi:2-polyprenyl-6-methoxyphenol hydroxylase-like FAD-dependent oxidoreductase
MTASSAERDGIAGAALRVAVIGGSIGGLCAGIALRGIGCRVEIFERMAGAVSSRGAGIVVQPQLEGLLRDHGAPELPATASRHRLFLDPDGGEGASAPAAHRFTSWSSIYRTLRSLIPDADYHGGATLSRIEAGPGRVLARFEEGGWTEADLLVCADGARSRARRRLLPGTEPLYAGYVAWRGTLAEEAASPALLRLLGEAIAFCPARSGGHILSYPIPGPGGATEPGRRRLNWVWYVKVPAGPPLDRLLTDRTGRRNALSVAAGLVPDALVGEIRATAARELHPRYAELVAATPDPFLQSIHDLEIPQMAFGRTCLVGDAAFVLRPHPAAATAKAVADAMALAGAIAAQPGTPEEALRAWEAQQLPFGRRLARYSVGLGRRSVEPPWVPGEDPAERFGGIGRVPEGS